MIVRFRGTRGSLPLGASPSVTEEKIISALLSAGGRSFRDRDDAAMFVKTELEDAGGFGGETSCVEVCAGDASNEFLLLDAGSGLASFSRDFLRSGGGSPAIFHLILSHLHWDHIQGFPFFSPAYDPEHKVVVHTCHPGAREALAAQMRHPFFPVGIEAMRAGLEFRLHRPGEVFPAAGFSVSSFLQNHPGDSYGYRLEFAGKSVIYSTDAERAEGVREPEFEDFCRGADLLVADAMFSREEMSGGKNGWGHGSNLDAVELALRAGVRRLALFHHSPSHDDAALQALSEAALRHAAHSGLSVFMARDGMELSL